MSEPTRIGKCDDDNVPTYAIPQGLVPLTVMTAVALCVTTLLILLSTVIHLFLWFVFAAFRGYALYILLVCGAYAGVRYKLYLREVEYLETIREFRRLVKSQFVEPTACFVTCDTTVLSDELPTDVDLGAVHASGKKEAPPPSYAVVDSTDHVLWFECTAGETICFDIVAVSKAGTVLVDPISGFAVSATGPATVPTSIECGEDGKHTVTFAPRRAGRYVVDVTYKDVHVIGSPYTAVVHAAEVEPTNCTLRGQGVGPLPKVVGVEEAITIESRDRFGNAVARGGEQHGFSFEFGGPFHARIDDHGNGTYTLFYTAEAPGLFPARVKYHSKIVQGGAFDFLILEPGAMQSVLDGVRGHTVKFKGILHTDPTNLVNLPEVAAKQSSKGPPQVDVSVIMTRKQLKIGKKSLMGLVSRRVYTARLRRGVHMTLMDREGFLSIDDGINQIVLELEDRDVFYGTAMVFIYGRAGHVVESFELKRSYLFDEIRRLHKNAMSDDYTHFYNMNVRRRNIITDTVNILNQSRSRWREKWRISFINEEGVDAGGLLKEFFTVLTRKLFSPEQGLFITLAEDKALLHPSPHTTKQQTEYYRFGGRLAAKCVYDAAVYGDLHPVAVHFTRSFYKQIVGLPVDYTDFGSDDPMFYQTKIKYVLEQRLDSVSHGVELYFAEEEFDSDGKFVDVHELVPGGASIPVTDKNKMRYLSLLSHYRLVLQSEEQINAFLEGFHSLIPEECVSIFDEGEIELLLCGLPEIDVDDFRANVAYGGWLDDTNQTIEWFWECVEAFTQEERARLLQFITGSSQVPVGGFACMAPQAKIVPSHLPAGSLPVAHTCFNRLDLPAYTSFKDLSRSLALAIAEGVEGFTLV